LRRDFIFDPYQVYASRVAGADAIFLLAAILGDKELARLAALTEQLGMTAVIEVGSSEEAKRVRPLQPGIVHINQRDWGTFRVRETAVAEIRPFFPPGTTLIGGGVRDRADAARLAQLEIDAILLAERSARDAANDSSFIGELAAAGKASV
jgi:indole-3-glycerol phosphate synthase